MKKLLVSAAVAATLTLGACGTTQTKSASSSSDYDSIVADAKAAHAFAAKNGNIWKQKKMKLPYVEHYLAEAEAAKAKGDEAGALKFAKMALHSANAEKTQVEKHASLEPAWRK